METTIAPVTAPLALPTPEDVASLIKLHPHLAKLLTSPQEIAGFVSERIIRVCPRCKCWCYEDAFRECVGYCPVEGSEYETREECQWCREDSEGW